MRVNKVPLADTHAFSPFFLDFIEKKENLAPFYNRYPDVTSFQDQIKEKKSSLIETDWQILSADNMLD
jgi:bacillithiol synthase